MVHRDVKPENMLVRDDGVVKVLDFGIARLDRAPSLRPPAAGRASRGRRAPPPRIGRAATETAATLEQSTFAGTPAYMAPEQIRARGQRRARRPVRVGRARVRAAHRDAAVDQRARQRVAAARRSSRETRRRSTPRSSACLRRSRRPSCARCRRERRTASRHGGPACRRQASRRCRASRVRHSRCRLRPTHRGRASPCCPTSASAPTIWRRRARIARRRGRRAIAVARSKPGGGARSRSSRPRWPWAGGLVAAAVMRSHASGGTDGAPPRRPASAARPATESAFQPARRRAGSPSSRGARSIRRSRPTARTVVFDTSVGDDVQIARSIIASGAQRRLTTQPGWHFSPAVSPDGASRRVRPPARRRRWGPGSSRSTGRRRRGKLVDGRMRPAWSPDGRALWAGSADAAAAHRSGDGRRRRARCSRRPATSSCACASWPTGASSGACSSARPSSGAAWCCTAAAGGPPSTFFADDTEDAIGLTPDGARRAGAEAAGHAARRALAGPARRLAAVARCPATRCCRPRASTSRATARSVIWSTCSTEQDLAALRGSGRQGAAGREPAPAQDRVDRRAAGGRARLGVAPRGRLGPREQAASSGCSTSRAGGRPRRLPTGDLEVDRARRVARRALVAFTAVGKGIHVVALDGSARGAAAHERRATTRAPTFSHDGRSVYFATASATRKRAIARVRVDGTGAAETVVEGGERPWASPDRRPPRLRRRRRARRGRRP